jgi:branched-chain amino acid transport system substrate-binding protein
MNWRVLRFDRSLKVRFLTGRERLQAGFCGLVGILLLLSWSENLKAEPVLKVGVIQSLTGIAAEDGRTVIQALELAKADINAAEPVRVELMIEDDQTTPTKTVSAYQKLKAAEVDVMIAATWDFTTNSLLPLAGRDRQLIFVTSCLPESLNLAQTAGFGFTNAVSVTEESKPFAQFIAARQVKRLVIVYANNSWGQAQLKVYRELALSQAAQVLEEVSSQGFDENEWAQILPRIKAKSPDAILLILNKNDIEVFLRRAHEVGLRGAFFASKNAFDAFRLTKNPGIYEGLCFTYPYEQVQAHAGFNQAYQAKFREAPRIYADNTYDALWVLIKAYELSLKVRISMKEALHRTDYNGLVGRYGYYAERSLSLGTSSLECVKEGSITFFKAPKN